MVRVPSRPCLALAIALAVTLATDRGAPPADDPATADATPAPDPAGDAEAIRARQTEMDAASLAGDREALLDLYHDDLIIMPPHAPAIRGAEAALDYFLGFQRPAEGESDLLEIEIVGDTAWARGQYVATLRLPSGEAVSDTGKMIEIWRRGDDGRWLLWRDIWSSDLPAESE